jgi:hypothetical protein
MHVVSKRGVLISGVVTWTRRKLNTLKMVASRSPKGITFHHSTGGQEISQPALRGLSFSGKC